MKRFVWPSLSPRFRLHPRLSRDPRLRRPGSCVSAAYREGAPSQLRDSVGFQPTSLTLGCPRYVAGRNEVSRIWSAEGLLVDPEGHSESHFLAVAKDDDVDGLTGLMAPNLGHQVVEAQDRYAIEIDHHVTHFDS